MARVGRRRVAPLPAVEREPEDSLSRAFALAWSLPPFSGVVLWVVSGNLALGLAFLGAGLAAVGFLLARYYGLQLEALEHQ